MEVQEETADVPLDYACSFCGSRFTSTAQLYGHLGKHKNLELRCDEVGCGAMVRGPRELASHKRLHTVAARPLRCPHCPSGYDKESALRYHVEKVHLKMAPHVCQECGKSFYKRDEFRRHVATQHEGVRAFSCHVCARRFSHVSNLNRHLRIHDNVRPYVCRHCGVRFVQLITLNKHVARRHPAAAARHHHQQQLASKAGRRSFHCSVCGLLFDLKAQLELHIRSEHSDGALACPQCRNHFTRVDQLVSHVCPRISSVQSMDAVLPAAQGKYVVYDPKPEQAAASPQVFLICMDEEAASRSRGADSSDQGSSGIILATSEDQHNIYGDPIGRQAVDGGGDVVLYVSEEVEIHTEDSQQQMQLSIVGAEEDGINEYREEVSEYTARELGRHQEQQKIEPANSSSKAGGGVIKQTAVVLQQLLDQKKKQKEAASRGLHTSGDDRHLPPARCLRGAGHLDPAARLDVRSIIQSYTKRRLRSRKRDRRKSQNSPSPTDLSNAQSENLDGETVGKAAEFRSDASEAGRNLRHLVVAGCGEDPLAEDLWRPFRNTADSRQQITMVSALTIPAAVVSAAAILPATVSAAKISAATVPATVVPSATIPAAAVLDVTSSAATVVAGSNQAVANQAAAEKAVIIPAADEGQPAPKWPCPICGKKFAKKSSLLFHQGTHSDTNHKFQCKTCKATFAWKSTLTRHVLAAHSTSDEELKCMYCSKVYRIQSVLKDHIRRDHLTERQHSCDICDKRFYKHSDLKVHKRVHLGIRLYMCSNCGKSFSHISHLYRHKRIHDRPRQQLSLACDQCDLTFTTKKGLKKHMAEHVSEPDVAALLSELVAKPEQPKPE